MQLSASACDPSTTSIRHVKVGKLPDATQSHIMQTRTSQSREATRPHLGIMWVTFGHLRSSGHICLIMPVIEAQCSWSWRLTITPHIKQIRAGMT